MSWPLRAGTKRFGAERIHQNSVEVIQLRDEIADLSVSIVPSHGNIAYDLSYKGGQWLWTPFSNPTGEMSGSNALFGIPLLSPWANRLSADTYSIGGIEHTLSRQLHNLRVDHNFLAIHGLVMFAPWTVVDLGADINSAYLRSTLNFAEHSDWMAQFPFAHRLELTHRISEGTLSISLSFINDSAVPIPLSLGFHPYFKLPESGRNSWRITCAGRKRMLLSDRYIPTGETESLNPQLPLKLTDGLAIDSVYTDLERNEQGCAQFSIEDDRTRLAVEFGPKYKVGVIYAPLEKDFVCVEPMTAPTDALHLAPAGLYDELQCVAPGDCWTESFWVKPEIVG